MHLERKKDLSIYYWLKDLFNSYSFITVEDGFPQTEISIPTVSIERDNIYIRNYEIGNNRGLWIPFWSIDIFAKNKSQRDELAFTIIDSLEEGIEVYDYDEGFPPVVVTQLGVLSPREIKFQTIKVIPDLVEQLYWRAQITFVSDYENKN